MSTRSAYQQLVEKNLPPEPPRRTSENQLDALLTVFKARRDKSGADTGDDKPDLIQKLRELTMRELIPIFVELKEKYSANGVSMEMDAANFLEGGREIKFEFGMGEYRSKLLGTVTTEAIAFHETRYAPNIPGELVSGPMLRLRHLDGQAFREFVCQRLAILLRTVLRHR